MTGPMYGKGLAEMRLENRAQIIAEENAWIRRMRWCRCKRPLPVRVYFGTWACLCGKLMQRLVR